MSAMPSRVSSMTQTVGKPELRFVAVLLVTLILIAAMSCWAPADTSPLARSATSGIAGTVTDILTGEPIQGALLVAGGQSTVSDSQGRYQLEVAEGMHTVTVEAGDYIGMSATRQQVQPQQLSSLDFRMVLAAPSPEERAALDLFFLPLSGTQLSDEEVASLHIQGFEPSSLSALPSTVRVLMPDGIVVVMSLDEYIKGVSPREMPPHWPAEALKAQAVAARCYAASGKRHSDVGADVCTTVHCQVWSPIHYHTTDQAVDATHNVSATYAGTVIRAFFHAHCNGRTHTSEEVWQAALPYCRSVSCPCGFKEYLGHGVGMCQHGARALAEQGLAYAEILQHYYTGVQVGAAAVHSLTQGLVRPASGDTTSIFSYEVLYHGADSPIVANLYVDGRTYAMSEVSGAANPQGSLYRFSTSLPAGDHDYAFRFEDGYNPPTAFPATGVLEGPLVGEAVHARPTHTPLPLAGTLGWQWVQSTIVDFSEGQGQNVRFGLAGDGEVQLASDALAGTYTSTVKSSPVDFVALGSSWLASTPTGTELRIELRASRDGRSWSAWQTVPLMDAEREATLLEHGELIYVRGPYLQYRLTLRSAQPGISPSVSSITLVTIDSRFGPTAEQAVAVSTTPLGGGPVIISREAWGADESLWNWEPEYRPVRKFVVHHTATPNGDLDPAATVRAIYYYHAVTRGWGDIGYNYLIDSQGRIYEGRRGGEGVVGGHAKQYAWGSIGVSFIGNYDEIELPYMAEQAAIELMAWKGILHFVDPLGRGLFIDQELPNIMGHRDGSPTTCPGRYAYARLPAIRQATASRMAELPPNVRLDVPVTGSVVGGVVDCMASASTWVRRVDFFLDGTKTHTANGEPFVWKWNAQAAPESQHTVKAVAYTDRGLTAEDEVAVVVDHGPPTGSIVAPAFSKARTVDLLTVAEDAAQMLLSNGWLWEGEALEHRTGKVVSDEDAWNGLALRGAKGTDAAGWWYGPYAKNLNTGLSYRVYFRLKVASADSSARVASIDVVDDLSRNVYAHLDLTGQDFGKPLVYQDRFLDFDYYRKDTYGLEFRTYFVGETDLYLDHVYVFRAPRAYRQTVSWELPPGDGPKVVAVRYVDTAGNLSPAYTTTVILDTALPEWMEWDGSAALVRDALVGIDHTSAAYSSSSDAGATWTEWAKAASVAADVAGDAARVSAPAVAGNLVRFRVCDRAKNCSESPAYAIPGGLATIGATATLTPSATLTLPSGTMTAPATTATATQPLSATPSPSPTASAAPTATPSATATPRAGLLRGRVLLQGRSDYTGVALIVGDVTTVTTGGDGRYRIEGLSPGDYAVWVRMPGYLETSREDILIPPGAEITLPDVTLRAGDVNADCAVDLFDLIAVAGSLASTGTNPARDINADGRVDILDLILVSSNYGSTCPSAWNP